MKISVCIGTYGPSQWERLATMRAFPSVDSADEILMAHEPKGTIASCRNALAARATGDWLCFLDADDALGPGYLEAMREHRAALPDGRYLLTPAVARVRKNADTAPFFHTEIDLAQANWLVIGTLIERDLFNEVGGFQDYPHGLEDWALWSSAYKLGAQPVKVHRAIYRWYPNRTSKHQMLMRSQHHDEVGLWEAWDKSWNESLSFAVRFDPARIVATGTPKMGHPLVRQLIEDDSVFKTRMRTVDNAGNLPAAVIAKLYAENEGTLRGRQELDGEWIAALEGDLLKRSWWRYYDHALLKEQGGRIAFGNEDPRFRMVIVSVDTPLKDKESSDFVAIQVWGVDRASRYLLDARTERMGFDATKRAIIDLSRWARGHWRTAQHRVLIENAGYGPDLILDLHRELGLVQKITANAEGSKGMRALAASADLETGNVYLPGRKAADGSGPDMRSCPAFTISLVEEAALFQLDGSHGSHDDQVDAWSQAMNWLRTRSVRSARGWSSFRVRQRA